MIHELMHLRGWIIRRGFGSWSPPRIQATRRTVLGNVGDPLMRIPTRRSTFDDSPALANLVVARCGETTYK
jgi:hypothetical protein